jgi:ribosome biogenesis GTPase
MLAERRPPHTQGLEGQVVANFGRHRLVELADSAIIECVTRGRRHDAACGDRVRVSRIDHRQGIIEAIAPRSTLLYRSDPHRQKLICANATQIAIVVAAVPGFSHDLVNRCLIAAEHGGMAALIVLNKSDLPQTADAQASLEQYQALGYRLVTLCARRDLQPLLSHLEAQASVLVGQSGMGKSTIINRLAPDAAARVADISKALHSGRHTTTHARLYRLGTNSSIIDTPGIQEFGLHHLDCEAVARALPEFRECLGHCRFRDCRHLAEPGCAVDQAYRAGKITSGRLASYRRLAQEIVASKATQPQKGHSRKNRVEY